MDKGDYGHAISDLIIVAESGHAPAEMVTSAATLIGLIYAKPDGIARDSGQAMHWFLIAADRGDGIAMNEIGLLMRKQRIVILHDNGLRKHPLPDMKLQN